MPVNETLINVPGRLHSVASEHHLGGANEIYDDDLNRLQSDINAETLTNVIPILYADLVELRDNNGLIPGKMYRITDYVTSTSQNYTRSAGHQFDIIVTALTPNTLCEQASAALHEGDTYFNSSRKEVEYWKIFYALDNDVNKYLWACPSDGAILIDRIWYVRHSTSDVSEANYPYAWINSANVIYTANAEPEANESAFSSSDGTGTENTILEFSKGKGVIYRMIDEQNNDIPYDFKNILFWRNILLNNTGLIITPSGYQDEKMRLIFNSLSETIANGKKNIQNTSLYYSTQNAKSLSGDYIDKDGNTITVNPNDKYVKIISANDSDIYCKLIDGEGKYTYTFVQGIFSKLKDATHDKYLYQYNNIVKPARMFLSNSDVRYALNNNVFCSENGQQSYIIKNNYIGDDCFNNTFTVGFQDNIIENKCEQIIVLPEVYNNIIRTGSIQSIINAYSYDNDIFIKKCFIYIYFIFNKGYLEECVCGKHLSYNKFFNVKKSFFKEYNYYLTITDSNNITLESYVTSINICCSDHIDLSKWYTTLISISFCKYLTLTSSQIPSGSSNTLKNLEIKGIVGTSENPKVISHDTLNDDFVTTYQPQGSQIINV